MANSTHSASLSQLNGSPGIPHKIAVRLPKILGNLVIYILVFLVVFYLKYKHLNITASNWNFLIIYLIAWAAGGMISGKFRFQSVTTLQSCLSKCYTSLLISLGVAAFLLAEFDSVSISRLVVVGSFFSAPLIEIAIFSYRNRSQLEKASKTKKKISIIAPVIDFFLLSWVLYFLYDYKIGFNNIDENQIILLSGTYLSWLLSAVITHQFTAFSEKTNVWRAISLQLKFYLLIIALMSFIVYIIQIDQYYRTLYLTAIIVYSAWSFIVMLFLYIDKLPQKTDDVAANFLHAYEIKDPAIPRQEQAVTNAKYKLIRNTENESPLAQKLEFIYFKQYPEIFAFLERSLDLNTFDIDNTAIVKSRNLYNVEVFPEKYLELFINLHKINDIRRINEYFKEVNKRMCDGGIFAGNFEPIKYRYDRFRNKYPFLLANTFYFFDFLWKRAAPKLPIIRKIYFFITNGQDRALSLAEGLGRLYFCGFEIIDLKVINNLCYFVAKEISPPSSDENPSFSPIIKMKRVGKDGELVYVYKLRTMHPYSEYIQDFVYKQSGLSKGDKFNYDFRVTKWGSFLRKYWIDELPMLVNLLKRDIKLVGVRPLSQHKLSLYNEKTRIMRSQYKPGLIPPYYVHLPKNLEEIMISENQYLSDYRSNKIKTDVKYFFKAFNNIVIKKERSA